MKPAPPVMRIGFVLPFLWPGVAAKVLKCCWWPFPFSAAFVFPLVISLTLPCGSCAMLSHFELTRVSEVQRKVHVVKRHIGTLAHFDLITVMTVNNLLGTNMIDAVVRIGFVLPFLWPGVAAKVLKCCWWPQER